MRPTNLRFLRPLPEFRAIALLAVTAVCRPGCGQDQPAPQPVTAIVAGTVHPVDGAAIERGVVLIRGDTIAAVGKQGEVEIPAGATVLSYPDGHVYPGLVDALSDAYTDANVRGDASVDAGTELALGLRRRDDSEDEQIEAGITTCYIGSRANTTWRGIGALVRPVKGGFEQWSGHQRAAVQARMSSGAAPSHPLQRQQLIEGIAKAFDGLDAYAKTFTDFDEAVGKYKKDFEAWLEFHRKSNGGGARPEGQSAPVETPGRAEGGAEPRSGRGPGRGRRGGGPGGPGGQRSEPPQAPAATPPANATGSEAKPAEAARPEAKPPERPKYPKPPARDAAKDALLDVQHGKLPLRLEVQRPDEIRGALALARDKQLPDVVLEQCYGAAAVADAIAEAGIACVLTDVAPGSMPKVPAFEDIDMVALPAALQRAGVGFAIASGSARRAKALRLMAASAVGKGLDVDAALRAITLLPAQILGVQQQVGSLTAGKLADVLVCDRPLFASDSRILRVLSKGQTQYEAK